MQPTPVEAFRADALPFSLGVIVATTGLVSCIWFLLRARRQDISLIYFGAGSLIYGLRMIMTLQSTRELFSAVFVHRAEFTMTFLVGIPFVLFFSGIIGGRWMKVVYTTVAIQSTLAVIGIYGTFTGIGFEFAKTANNVVAIGLVALLFLIVFFPGRAPSRELRVLQIGATILALFSLYTNLVSIGAIRGNGGIEPLGFLLFLCCLGYVSARRTIRTEEHLVSIRNELEIAQRIQSGLLPSQGFAVPHLEIATQYVPLSSVAGDFYDFLVAGPHTGVLIADVTGHGVPAALTASMVKVAIRAQSANAANPSEVLAGINSILHGIVQGQFVTAAYVYFDPENRQLAYSGAGHPPLLVWRGAQKRVEVLESNGLFLGPFPAAEYPTLNTSFAPGDRCLLYTDGITEAENPAGEEFGQARLKEFLAENAAIPGDEFCHRLLRHIQDWTERGTEGEQNDDLTIIAVDYR